jgi:bifunctional DNase/RNase
MSAVECELARIVMSEGQDQHLIVLKEKDGERALRIYISGFEVFAIYRFVNNQTYPRPLTHELFGNVLDKLGITIERAVVCDIQRDETGLGGTYFGRLILSRDGETYDIDSRPSDAIAMAVQKGAPIFVEESVFSDTEPSV